MAAVVVFVTTYSLILPAITIEVDQADEMAGFDMAMETRSAEASVDELLSSGPEEYYGDTMPFSDTDNSFEANDGQEELLTSGDSFMDTSNPGTDETSGSATLTAGTDKVEATVSCVSGNLLSSHILFSLKELNNEVEEFEIYRQAALDKACEDSFDMADETDWSACDDVRILDFGFSDPDGFDAAPAEELYVELSLTEPIRADLCRIILLTDNRDKITDEAAGINEEEAIEARSNDTLQVVRNDENEIVGLNFKAELLSLAALLTKTEPEETTESAEAAESSEALAEEPAAEQEDPALLYPAQEFEGNTGTVHVSVKAGIGAFPPETTMTVEDIDDTETLAVIEEAVEQNVAKVHAVEITFYDKAGIEIEPLVPVHVTMTAEESASTEEVKVIHVDNEGVAAEVEDADLVEHDGEVQAQVVEQASFDAAEFSIYALVYTVYTTVISDGGETYNITVTYGSDAGIPEGAYLTAEEILPSDNLEDGETDVWQDYVSMVGDTLGWEGGSASYIRLFDISIVDENGEKVKIEAPVDVKIELADTEVGNLAVVHFADGQETAEVMDNTTEMADESSVVAFETDGFSVYAVVEAPDPYDAQIQSVQDLEELADNTGTKFYLSVALNNSTNRYFRNSLNANNAFIVSTDISAADGWYFESAGGGNQYYIYTYVDNKKQYMRNRSGGNLMDLVDDSGSATVFEISQADDGLFTFKKRGEGRWLQYSGSGSGIRMWTDANNATNSQITITYASSLLIPDDPYGLDGATYGIAYYDDNATSAALTAEGKTVSGQSRLNSQELVMKPDVQNNNGILLVAENSDITEWTFESVREDKYYLSTTADGTVKYLTINGRNVTLTDQPDETYSLITVTPGNGANSGKYHFSVNGYSLNLTGTTFNGATGSGAATWMSLVERSTLSEDDFVNYTARKISVSDPALKGTMETDDEGNETGVHKKAQVILYTRLWNDSTKKYEFYAVDHNGSLIRVYESGDVIQWVGNRVNSALWEFTEYTDDGTINGNPTDYYELENTAYSGEYLAPQSGGIISDHTVGINLEGRTGGFDYTSVVAWDDAEYAYVGLKIDTTSMKVVTCPLDEADDFYFASIVPTVEEAAPVSNVATVDNNAFGISMKMKDFNDVNAAKNRDRAQDALLGEVSNQVRSGLLSANFGSDGYPTTTDIAATPNTSFGTLFSGMTPVNHLFIQSIYNESGYFEYDSTQNFAHLNEDGTFTVYDQLGAITGNSERRNTRTHGQFMPYDDISEEKGYAIGTDRKLITNQTDVLGRELPDSNPRKGEALYNLGSTSEVDYFFGMELEASFTQSPDGLDDWDHDIIFEFSGDDDFWLYVDGILVLDLGDIHSAQEGSVNFRTGKVTSSRGNTTLYEIFRQHYQGPGSVDDLFQEKEVDGEVVHVFKDYSKHTMKMFYMERGAGASNLHMRFNLASVEPASVELTKKLTGTDSASNKLIQYPYQIWYTVNEQLYNEDGSPLRDEQGNLVTQEVPYLLVQGNKTDQVKAVFKGTKTLIPYKDSMSIDGRTYENVFLLKAGQTAVINLPENVCSYKIIECGIDTEVYPHVYVNGEDGPQELTGQLYNNTDTGSEADEAERQDFGIEYDTTENRSRVEYTNQIDPKAMRTMSFTKVVYDTTGERVLDTDEVTDTFTFRLYLGDEYSDADNLSLANMYAYYVKDTNGCYCRWNSVSEKFEPVEGNIQEFSALSAAQKKAATFTTSINGTVSRIPAGYTVEVRDLIVGAKWKLEERDWEIPKGYTRREADGYVRTDLGPSEIIYVEDPDTGYGPAALNPDDPKVALPVSETIKKDENAHIQVRNQEGWGLTAKKIWTDSDFMSHDDIFFAVYLQNDDGSLGSMIEDSVRRLQNGETEVYYFFSDLRDQVNKNLTHTFSEYVVREVIPVIREGGSITVDETTGVVSGYSSVTPIQGTEDDNTLTVGGTPANGEHQEDCTYTVHYQVGGSTGENAKIRTDTVTNSRPGIELYKMKWDGTTPLAGAKFTLTNAEGGNVAAARYTSDENGKITIAYLSAGEYTLTETVTPKGYTAPSAPLKIIVGEDGTVSIHPEEEDETLYLISTEAEDGLTEGMTARITVKNRSSSLQVKKTDAETGEGLEEVPFALYRQASGIKPLTPMEGYEDLVTTSEGILTEINLDNLRAGTYYLTEKESAPGYQKLQEDVIFTIGADGSISVESEEQKGWLTSETDPESGQVCYTLTVPNSIETIDLNVQKIWTDSDTVDHSADKITYRLYRIPQHDGVEYAPEEVTGAEGFTGQLKYNADENKRWKETISGLPKAGEYTLQDGTRVKATYRYYISEDYFEGYKSDTKGTFSPDGDTFTVTIINEPHSSFDTLTEAGVVKEWRNKEGDLETSGHEDDTITFRILQKKYPARVTVSSGTVFVYPVRVNLINGDNTLSSLSTTYYVPAGSRFRITVSCSFGGAFLTNTRVRGHGFDWGDNNEHWNGHTFRISSVDGAREVTLELCRNRDAVWGTTEGALTWVPSLWGPAYTENQLLDELNVDGEPLSSKQFEYLMELNETGTDTILKPLEYAQGVGSGDGIWRGTVSDLPFYEEGDETNPFYIYTYELSEVKIGTEEVSVSSPPDGFNGQTGQYYVKWSEDDSGNWTITNQKKQSIRMNVLKVDMAKIEQEAFSASDTLAGAAFALEKYTDRTYRQKDSSWEEQMVNDTGGTGEFSFDALTEGYYQLVETECPPGYVRTSGYPRFRVTEDLSIVLVDENGNDVSGNLYSGARADQTTVIVGNSSGAALPATGGPGTKLFYLIGSFLTLGAGMILLLKRRRRTE